MKYQRVTEFIQQLYQEDQVLLHRPIFNGNEKTYLADCIDSNFVSSVGTRVTEFEQTIATYTGAKYAIATVNGTAALHIALLMAGVKADTEVITQALTFIATCNAISYVGAKPVFVDVDRETLGLSPDSLKKFLQDNVEIRDGIALNKGTGRKLSACVPMHTFGHPCRIDEIVAICGEYGIPVIEDAAESLGSYYRGRHTGTFGRFGVFSFNGNKIITTGGGGMIVTDDPILARRTKHITTTAKIPHPFEYTHDRVGYNYRLPNLNAALGCAQIEQLDDMLKKKREVAEKYTQFFPEEGIVFIYEPPNARSNFWLNAIVLESLAQRNEFLEYTNQHGVMTRPIWRMMTQLEMFKGCQHDGLENSRWLEERIVNIPSSVPTTEREA